MEKAVQLHLLIKLITVSLFSSAVISGCATSARELPSDYGSVDARKRLQLNDFDATTATLSCAEANKELRALEAADSRHIQTIKGNRKHNQITGYIGTAFFLPVYLATDNDLKTKEKIRNINKAKDKLYKLKAFKKCT